MFNKRLNKLISLLYHQIYEINYRIANNSLIYPGYSKTFEYARLNFAV